MQNNNMNAIRSFLRDEKGWDVYRFDVNLSRDFYVSISRDGDGIGFNLIEIVRGNAEPSHFSLGYVHLTDGGVYTYNMLEDWPVNKFGDVGHFTDIPVVCHYIMQALEKYAFTMRVSDMSWNMNH